MIKTAASGPLIVDQSGNLVSETVLNQGHAGKPQTFKLLEFCSHRDRSSNGNNGLDGYLYDEYEPPRVATCPII